MKTLLKELIEIVRDMKPEISCTISFDKDLCDSRCRSYKQCEDINKHREKCDDLLNKLKVKNLTL